MVYRVFRPVLRHIAKFDRMPNNGVRAVGQAIDDSVILAIDQDDLGRDMARRSVRIDYNSCRNFIRVDAARNGNGSSSVRRQR